MGMFDDLIPEQPNQVQPEPKITFDDLIPQPTAIQEQPDLAEIPEFGTVDGNSALFGDGEGFLDGNLGGDVTDLGTLLKDGLAQTFTFNPKARVDGIEKRFPQLEVRRTENGKNAIVVNPQTGKQAIVNKDGFSAQDFAQLSGGILSFTPAAKGIGLASSTGGKVAAAAGGSALTDAAIQGVEHIQGSDQGFSAKRTAAAGVLGGGVQKVAGGIGQSIENGAVKRILEKAAPSVDQLKDRAATLYNQVDNLGITLKPEAFQGLTSKLQNTFKAGGFIPENESGTANVIRAFTSREGQSLSFSEIDQLRKALGNTARNFNNPSDSAAASKLIATLDDTLSTLPKGSVTSSSGVNPTQAASLLKEARGEVFKRKKAETLEIAIERGKLAASGAENGIRNEFRTISKRIASGKERGFSETEAALIKRVADGDGANILRLIGKGSFDPSNNNFLGGSIGAGTASMLGGAPGLVAQQAASGGAKKLAERVTKNNANLASAITRAGNNSLQIARAYVKTVPKGKRNAEELAEIIRAQGADSSKLLQQATALGGGNKQMVIDAAKLLLGNEAAN